MRLNFLSLNVYNLTGTAAVRKADASVAGKEANGFVLAVFTHPTNATVYAAGNNTGVTGLTLGRQFLSTTPGAATSTAPSGSGNVCQMVKHRNKLLEVSEFQIDICRR